MIRWELIERITHLTVTALLAVWLYLLTDWVTVIDAGQNKLAETLVEVVKIVQRFMI